MALFNTYYISTYLNYCREINKCRGYFYFLSGLD